MLDQLVHCGEAGQQCPWRSEYLLVMYSGDLILSVQSCGREVLIERNCFLAA